MLRVGSLKGRRADGKSDGNEKHSTLKAGALRVNPRGNRGGAGGPFAALKEDSQGRAAGSWKS